MDKQVKTPMPMQSHFRIRGCPICECDDYKNILDLKDTALGDRFVNTQSEAKRLKKYPLYLVKCERCSHCYIPILTNQDDSYSNYLFQSSQSPGLLNYFAEITNTLKYKHNISKSDVIVDIGANDGTWLCLFKDSTDNLIGVEPAPFPADQASKKGLTIINEYFSKEVLYKSNYLTKSPRLVSMNYVFANLPNPKKALEDIISISDDNTVISILTGYHPSQLAVSMFDYIYHEHLSYFNCNDFANIAKQLKLKITSCNEVPIKGGSLHIELQKVTSSAQESSLLAAMIKRENWINQPEDIQWRRTRDSIQNHSKLAIEVIKNEKSSGCQVIGYGASHSTTTLQYALGIENHLDYLVDDNIQKRNKFSPGNGLKVYSSNILNKVNTCCIIILAWQHTPKIVNSLRVTGFKGKVIIPFPTFEVQVFN